MKMLMLW